MQYNHSWNYKKTHKTRIDSIEYARDCGKYCLIGYDRFTNTSGHQILVIDPHKQGNIKHAKGYTRYKGVAMRWQRDFESGKLVQFSY